MSKPPRDLERAVQKSGNQILMARFPIVLFRRNVTKRREVYKGKTRWVVNGSPGMADTYGWDAITGRHIEIEWKRLGERPNDEQIAWLRRCSCDGAIAFWVDNVDTALLVMGRLLHPRYYVVWFDNGDFDLRRSSTGEADV